MNNSDKKALADCIRIEAITESFINGNISWVKSQLRTKKDVAKVAEMLQETAPAELASFLRIMSN